MLHALYFFEEAGASYAADLEKARVVELSAAMADILKLAETQTHTEIVRILRASYAEEAILEAFERLTELEKEGLLFNFSADDEETLSVLPIFFQALDLVCFPAMPGTPLSIVLEAMAYGAPYVAMTKYGMPAEVADAGAVVESDWDHSGNFQVPMATLSETIHTLLKPCVARVQCEDVAKGLAQKFTWEKVAQEIVQCFEEGHQQSANAFRRERNVSPLVFCRRYDPGSGTTESSAYRAGSNRYDCLETALAEILAEQHTPAEIEAVFRHFQGEGLLP